MQADAPMPNGGVSRQSEWPGHNLRVIRRMSETIGSHIGQRSNSLRKRMGITTVRENKLWRSAEEIHWGRGLLMQEPQPLIEKSLLDESPKGAGGNSTRVGESL